MPTLAPIRADDDLFVGEDYKIWFRVFSEAQAILSAAAIAGATSLSVQSLHHPLSSGDKLFFADAGFMVKLAGNAAIGATTLSVAALSGPLKNAALGHQVPDISGFTMQWILETKPDGTTILSKTPILVDDEADGDGSPSKLAQVSVDAADLMSYAAASLYHRLRRIDTGSVKTLAQGNVALKSH